MVLSKVPYRSLTNSIVLLNVYRFTYTTCVRPESDLTIFRGFNQMLQTVIKNAKSLINCLYLAGKPDGSVL